MDFQAYLEDTYRIIKEEPLVLILGGLIVQLLTVFSLGILAGPILGGYALLVILYLRENRKPVFNDIFSGLQDFANLFPYFLVLLLIFFGFILLILPGLLFATWWLYVLPLMVDRKMSFTDAMRVSMNTVNEKGFLMHLVFLLLISVIPIMIIDLLSTVIPFLFLLKILLTPFQVGCLSSLYIHQFGSPTSGEFQKKNEEPAGPGTEAYTVEEKNKAEQTGAVVNDVTTSSVTAEKPDSRSETRDTLAENEKPGKEDLDSP